MLFHNETERDHIPSPGPLNKRVKIAILLPILVRIIHPLLWTVSYT